MHHCVGTYAERCLRGGLRIFSIRKDDSRIRDGGASGTRRRLAARPVEGLPERGAHP